MTIYKFHPDELPFKFDTALRFFCKSCVSRRQFDPGTRVNFSRETVTSMVVPSDDSIQPYIMITCPRNGHTLRLNVHLQPERDLLDHRDATAYLRRVLCVEAISVTTRDLQNTIKHGPRGHYTEDFFREQLEKYEFRVSTFHTYNMAPDYD